MDSKIFAKFADAHTYVNDFLRPIGLGTGPCQLTVDPEPIVVRETQQRLVVKRLIHWHCAINSQLTHLCSYWDEKTHIKYLCVGGPLDKQYAIEPQIDYSLFKGLTLRKRVLLHKDCFNEKS